MDDVLPPALSRETAPADPRDHELAELRRRLAATEREAAELRMLLQRITAAYKARLVDRKAAPLPSGPAPADAYALWIANRTAAATSRRDWLAERVRQWPHPARLALAMIVPAGNEAPVALTLASLGAQMVGEWELHVAAERAQPEAFADEPRLLWHCEPGLPAEILNRRLAQSAADWVALIDAGDQLAPHALFAVADALFRHPEWSAVYSDEDRIDAAGTRSAPHFKPDFNLDLLRSLPYVGGLLAVRRELFGDIGGFDACRDGTEEYDLTLRLAERVGAAGIGHVADVLYHRSTSSGRSRRPVAAICADMPAIVQAHLDRLGVAATAETGVQPQFCRVRYRHDGPEPLVSILVPTRDQPALLKRCVESVLQGTEYQNYELILIDNDTTDPEAAEYLRLIDQKEAEIGSRVRVLRHPGPFNFSAMNNRAVRETARGEYLCLLNNDVAPLGAAWLGELMAQARRPEVGAVGAKLLYPDGRIQHAGVILGVNWGAPAGHPYIGEPGEATGYWGRLQAVQSMSAVTAACLLTRRSIYEQLGGLDEDSLTVSYNDVDYCLRLREAGLLVVWTPFARLLHQGSASLQSEAERREFRARNHRFAGEERVMYRRWLPRIAGDPAYNRNLSCLGTGFAIETEGPPSWDPEFRPRPRILAYPADSDGCGEYRIIAPTRALFAAGRVQCQAITRLMTPPEIARIAPDSIVFQRQLEPHQIEAIERAKAFSPALRVFELDDLITDLPAKSIHRAAIPRDIGKRLATALSLCDRLVVSTEPLAERYGRLCGETVVLPNRLEKRRWLGLEPRRPVDGKPRVGWAGALGHSGDLELLAGVVEATARQVDWVFFGMCPDRLRRFAAEFHEWEPLHNYPRKLADLALDLAVAPLEQNPFNTAKSNLRLLEYGVLGYPVLCSDVRPYRCGLPVFRVANRPREWIKAIRELTADREACRLAGERLREAVRRDWMLEDHLDEWQRAWLP
jgi:GT2 family glycosyltransferase